MGEEINMREIKKPAEVEKPHFVLVHGISGGAWCWYKVRCLMENSGYKVSCINLKGSGTDPSDANSIHSFDDYNKPLMDFMSSLTDNEKVILVGHSAGGLSITQASHKFGNKIRLAVYLAATMLKLGFCTDEDVKDLLYEIMIVVKIFCGVCFLNDKQGIPDLSAFGNDVYQLGFGLGADQPPTSAIVKQELQRKIIYQMSPQEDSTLAAMLVRPGPILALRSARFTGVNHEEVDRVPRVYIKTMHDRVVKPEQQDAMIKRWPPSDVYALDSDHSPFFSAPFLLAGFLIKAAASVGCN
ncbi:methylesterase 17 [Citrus sinensis]|uniref:Methylesterase 17 n=1 Tax=Citrus sinensis TaxID=2711 RepID=A0ACB8L2H7_CITSI|nr:methylesterase 17 [Citrus sinensis]